MTIQIVILAAGCGKRMHSTLPKVLHLLAGKPLLAHVLDTAMKVSNDYPPIVVFGHQGNMLKAKLTHLPVHWIEQKQQLGTGHAVMSSLSAIKADHVLVLYGDVPLITTETLQNLIDATPQSAIGLVTAHFPDPTGYGRIKRNKQQKIESVIEDKEASEFDRLNTEINSGIYFVPLNYLKKWLPALSNQNGQQEYYLTDIISFAVSQQVPIVSVTPPDYHEVMGVNDRAQLAALERSLQAKRAEAIMLNGATLIDPARIDIRGEVEIGRDVVIDVNVVLEGKVVIGDHCMIGPNVFIRDAVLGDGVVIKANCVIEEASISDACFIGPFARIRPGTSLEHHVHIGNFVEVKKSKIMEGTKINHLSYVGDSEIGRRVNIGAGTITCNYDGANKHKTVIGDNVHIGSDTLLVAPIMIGEGATIGAGSTLLKDAPADKLTLTHRIDQRVVSDWKRPEKMDSES